MNIYDRDNYILSLRYAAFRSRRIRWDIALRARGSVVDSMFALRYATRLIPNPFDKLKVRSSLQIFHAVPRPSSSAVLPRLRLQGGVGEARHRLDP